MGTKYIKCIIFSILLWFGINNMLAAPVSISASLDSVNLLMGKQTLLKLHVSQPAGVKGAFPIFSKTQENGIIPVCGDSVELRTPSVIDTVRNGNQFQITYSVPLQAFDSGYYQLPQFIYVVDKDTLRSNALALKVVPVLADAKDPIADYAGVAEPENSSIFDSVPDWVLDYWWILIVIIAAIILFIYGYRLYSATGSILPQKPAPTPYEIAVSALSELKAKKLWEQGMEKEYFSELTEILREYLHGRFGINAMEMTSRQILTALSKNPEIKDKKKYFRKILDMADFVKFARVRPLPEDNIESFENAVKFVEETKPLPPVDESEKKGDQSKKGDLSEKKGGEK